MDEPSPRTDVLKDSCMRVRIRYAFPTPGKIAKTLSGLVRDVLDDIQTLSQEDEVLNDSRDEDVQKSNRS